MTTERARHWREWHRAKAAAKLARMNLFLRGLPLLVSAFRADPAKAPFLSQIKVTPPTPVLIRNAYHRRQRLAVSS